MTEQRPVIAYVLDLFGAPPKPVRAWRRPIYAWVWAGVVIPPDADAMRQARMLRADTVGADRA